MNNNLRENRDLNCKISALKIKTLEFKETLIKSEFWDFTVNKLKSEISESWCEDIINYENERLIKNKRPYFSIVMFVVGLGSLEASQHLNAASFFQLAAVMALNEIMDFESIYFCDPEFTFLDNDIIFELFMTLKTHIEVFTGNDLSMPLNNLHDQLKNKKLGRNRKIKFFFFMPHCDRCVFGMLIHYFSYGKGKYLYSDSSRIIVWGNNLNTFKIDSHKNFNEDCEFCKVLSLVVEKKNLSSEETTSNYNTAFNYSFSDLSIYSLPIRYH